MALFDTKDSYPKLCFPKTFNLQETRIIRYNSMNKYRGSANDYTVVILISNLGLCWRDKNGIFVLENRKFFEVLALHEKSIITCLNP